MSGTHTVYDAIVVGSGAAGSWAVKDLTEGGLNVLLLEAGRTLDVARDFPADPPSVTMNMIRRIGAGVRGQYIQVRCGLLSETNKHLFVNDRDNPYTTPRGKPFTWIRGRQIGGRLHTWGRHAPRFSKFEFKPATLRGEGVDWPLSYDDIHPHYDRIERTLGLRGTFDGIPNCPDGQYVRPGVTTKRERRFLTEVETNLPGVRVGHGRYLGYDSGRIPLPLRMAMDTGRLEIRSDAVVSRLLTDPRSGKATGVEYVDRSTRKTHVAAGKVVVLCASAIESVRILLNSESSRHPAGIGGSTGQLGHYLCDHVTYLQRGKLPDAEAEPVVKGDDFDFGGAGLYIPSFCEREPKNFTGRYGIQTMIGHGGASWMMFAHGEMQLRYENRISIDTSRKDAWGIPVARVECTHSDNDRNMIAHMKQALPNIAAAGGLEVNDASADRGSVLYRMLQSQVFSKSGALWPGGAVHEMGGARMGDKAETSVVNSYGQCWDAENVFVTDGACFTYPGFQNPTLTIMALTSRACQFIVQDYGNQVH